MAPAPPPRRRVRGDPPTHSTEESPPGRRAQAPTDAWGTVARRSVRPTQRRAGQGLPDRGGVARTRAERCCARDGRVASCAAWASAATSARAGRDRLHDVSPGRVERAPEAKGGG